MMLCRHTTDVHQEHFPLNGLMLMIGNEDLMILYYVLHLVRVFVRGKIEHLVIAMLLSGFEENLYIYEKM